jgi:hypothetical protein
MKFTDIAAVAKRSKTAIIMNDNEGGQWLSNGAAAYRLVDMPLLNEDTVLAVMGVIGTSKERWYVNQQQEESEMLLDRVENETEITGVDAGLSVVYDKRILTPFHTQDGILWVDGAFMQPIVKMNSEYKRFYIRDMGGDRRAIAVKDGMILMALIVEYRMTSEEFAIGLENLSAGARRELARVKNIETKSTEGESVFLRGWDELE